MINRCVGLYTCLDASTSIGSGNDKFSSDNNKFKLTDGIPAADSSSLSRSLINKNSATIDKSSVNDVIYSASVTFGLSFKPVSIASHRLLGSGRCTLGWNSCIAFCCCRIIMHGLFVNCLAGYRCLWL